MSVFLVLPIALHTFSIALPLSMVCRPPQRGGVIFVCCAGMDLYEEQCSSCGPLVKQSAYVRSLPKSMDDSSEKPINKPLNPEVYTLKRRTQTRT